MVSDDGVDDQRRPKPRKGDDSGSWPIPAQDHQPGDDANRDQMYQNSQDALPDGVSSKQGKEQHEQDCECFGNPIFHDPNLAAGRLRLLIEKTTGLSVQSMLVGNAHCSDLGEAGD